MAFELYSEVVLTRDVAEEGLRAGDVGTVVERHVAPGAGDEGYSIEFFDMTSAPFVRSSSIRLSEDTIWFEVARSGPQPPSYEHGDFLQEEQRL